MEQCLSGRLARHKQGESARAGGCSQAIFLFFHFWPRRKVDRADQMRGARRGLRGKKKRLARESKSAGLRGFDTDPGVRMPKFQKKKQKNKNAATQQSKSEQL